MTEKVTIKFIHRTPDRGGYSRTAFDNSIGKQLQVRLADGSLATGRLLNAVVAEDRMSVELTLEIDAQKTAVLGRPNSFSWWI